MIGLTKLRDLSVVDENGTERNLPIAAASALLRVGDYLLVLSDDERQMAIIEEGSDEPGTLIKVMDGTTPSSPDERAGHKPDFECMAHLDPFDRFDYGRFLPSGPDRLPTGTRPRS